MSWSLGWKRSSENFRLTLLYDDNQVDADTPSPLQTDLDWYGYEDEEQVALRLQSEITVALPPMKDSVAIEFEIEEESRVRVLIRVLKRREELKEVVMTKETGSGTVNDGCGVLRRLLRSGMDCWDCVRIITICECGLLTVPEELTQLPLLEELYLYNNRLSQLPAELGKVKRLKVLNADNNMLVSLPVELKQCVMLVELSLENNKLVRPLLDFRSMAELRILRLFGNPLEFLPEILPLNNLRHLSLANIRIEATENLKSVHVEIETDNSSYFIASRHKLSNFFSLIFRFSSCHHPLLASALAQMMQDSNNHIAISKEENSIRQLISMIRSDSRHVVEQACIALSSLARDVTLAMQLIKADIMMPIEFVLKSVDHEEVISVLEVVVTLALASDNVAYRMMLVKDLMKSLKHLCTHKNVEVQRLALFAIGNLAFCLENRRILTQSQSLQELLIRLTLTAMPRVNKAAARALAILGENEKLRRAVKGKPVDKRGLRILSMDGGGMKGLATVQMLKQIEQGTGKHIHELFDLVCGTSTGGMLAVALTIKQMSLEQCEEIYKNLGKLVFTEPVSKDEAVTWREKLDQLYKSSSQRFRVVVHGSKHSADNFERLLKEMCTDEDGDLLIESAVKGIPKVFVVSTLVSVTPAQPFLFRNYQYPAGTPELLLMNFEGSAIGSDTNTCIDQPGVQRRGTFMGSCKHQTWEAIRASSAAPYYLDDFSVDVNRWQDGAIVANNPTIFAIREAQLLWPDAKIDCLVSIGCGEIPTKARKGGWRYLDTGQVLIESACSVERVEEALDTLVPLLPGIHYYRFCPVDERFDMELDETDPAIWLKLEAATEEYINKNSQVFKNACDRLHARNQDEDGNDANLGHPKSGSVHDDYSPSLGWRHMLLLVESSNSPYSGKPINHVRSIDTYCARNNIRMSLSNMSPGPSRLTISIPNPCAPPLYTGSFPSSPLLRSPNCIPKRASSTDTVPSLTLDDHRIENIPLSLPTSPSEKRQPPPQVRSIFEKIQSLPQVGVIHFALQNDSTGSILSWRNDVFVVAEPGELADKFLRSVNQCLLSTIQSRKKKDFYSVPKISSLSELVAQQPKFEMHGVLHRYIGCQTQVMEDNREIGAYMFRRTVPDVHLTSEDVRWMVGAWRDRIIIYTGKCSPSSNLLKAFLDSGAKAIIASKTEPPNTQFITDHSLNEYSTTKNHKFMVGDEETDENEEPESELSNHVSAMEDGYEPFDDRYEEDLSQFICVVYDMLFQRRTTINVALQHALGLYPKLRYACHLPN